MNLSHAHSSLLLTHPIRQFGIKKCPKKIGNLAIIL